MNDLRIEPQWVAAGAALVVIGAGGFVGLRAYQRRARRKSAVAFT